MGDAGYQGVEKRKKNGGAPLTWHVAMRPSKRRPLSKDAVDERLERIEHTKVSHLPKWRILFHAVKNLFRNKKTRYRGLAKNTAQMFSLFGLANLMLARRWPLDAASQVASPKREMGEITH